MKRLFTGFCMAWGMFLAIPCPFRRWDDAARMEMLCCLPLIGALVGLLWWAAVWLGNCLPAAFGAVVCAAAPWLVTGFLHLDGFMDVCDAVLSRRDLATRQAILKDSHCGAFGVISMILLALVQWSAFWYAGTCSWALLMIPVVTRSCSGLAVLLLGTCPGSQYAEMSGGRLYGVVWLSAVLAAALVVSAVVWDSFAPLVAAICYWLAALSAHRQLGGMSGDVSGYALSLAEMAGSIVLVVGL